MKKTALVVALASYFARPADGAPAPQTPPRVLIATYSGIISPVAAEYLQAAVARAQEERFDAVVVELDTPGGLDLSMREIVKAELSSQVPVIVFVSPSGARAASAGVFITMAAHVAAMTPGTNIGAAHPVQLGAVPGTGDKEKGKASAPDSVMETKLTNDFKAYLEAIADRRGRNADWAAFAVTQSSSVTSGEAVRLRIIDMEADNLEALLAKIDGRKLADFPKRPLRTKDAALTRFPMTQRQKLLAAVSDPNVAMILMTLGVSGLLIELYSPGLILPGLVGAVSLILGFYSFQTLSANYAGVLLILLGFILFILELKVTSFGLLALSGTAAVLFGSMMVFKDAGGGMAISPWVIWSTVGTMGALALGIGWIVKQAMGGRSRLGTEAMRGEKGVVLLPLGPVGTVQIHDEVWRAESLEGDIPAKESVVVVEAEGLTLKVRRAR